MMFEFRCLCGGLIASQIGVTCRTCGYRTTTTPQNEQLRKALEQSGKVVPNFARPETLPHYVPREL